MGQNAIVIKGAREHNLKDIDLSIPRDELVVITGLSGSGKSSLAFDTMYAEGQRRYVESLSSYARMFLGQMSEARPRQHRRPVAGGVHRPEDHVEEPALDGGHHHRDLRLPAPPVRARGRAALPRVRPRHQEADHRPGDRRQIPALAPDAKAIVMAPVVAGRKGEFTKLFADLQKEGFSRVRIDGEIVKLDGEPRTLNKKIKHFIDVVVDRVQLKASATSRIAEAVEELATKLADGRVLVQVLGDDGKPARRGRRALVRRDGRPGRGGAHLLRLALACPEHGHSMDELQPRNFSFNAPYGACPDCAGLGFRLEVDPRTGRARRGALPRRRRGHPLELELQIPQEAPRVPLQGTWICDGNPVEVPAQEGQGRDPVRQGLRGHRQVP